MATVLLYPNKLLKQTSEVVGADEDLTGLITDMTLAMYDRGGIGLAAVQIGVLKRLILVDVSAMKQPPIVMINPRIVHRSVKTDLAPEGCLSVPGIEARVERPSTIVVEYHDEQRKHCVRALEGLLARCVQHEVDHLDGTLFVDRLSAMRRRRVLDRYARG